MTADAMRVSDEELEAFWEDAKVRAGLNPARAYTGPNVADSLRPPAWSFGADPEQADRLLALVLAGTKTAAASAVWEYEADGDALPEPGDLSIVLDGGGHPRALIRTTDVRVVPFGEVDADHAYAEGEDDRTLASWRVAHETYLDQVGVPGGPTRDDLPVVLERFEVLVPPESRPGSPRMFGR